MGGSSWGHKGGVLGAVPLERKTPGFLAFGLCGFSSGFSVWGCLFGGGWICICVVVLGLCVFVLVVWPGFVFSWLVGIFLLI